ncbi:hypothetical protein BDK63_002464 [Halomonas campaniensis]|uniref:Uncharacterized protein n=1 Tax=Halomonas campaniensis TaxID=213554 RepID=A0A7W5PC33_9GAMM|nr:hypothetical protein [Halomonas campaniensis]MBB3331581.1 hypothetical protein [Halomonas campaniensis]
MNLIQELHLRTRHLTPQEVLRDLGYGQPDADTLAHYQAVIGGRYLGLERQHCAPLHGETGFIEALCRCVGIAESDYRPGIAAVAERLAEDRAAFRHWLFADTDYVRAPGTPIFAMAFTERFRRLPFPIDFWRLPWEERLEAACQKAREHRQESSGTLVIWGEIQRYHYCFAEKRSIVISTTGEVIGECHDFDPPKATMSLAGSDENLPDQFAPDEE